MRDWFVCCLRPYLPRSSKLIGLVVPANPIKENNFLIGPAQSEGELIAFWLHISIIKKWFPFRSIVSNSVVKGFLVTKKKVGGGKKFPWRTYWAWWSNPVGNPAASRSSRLILHISRLLFTLADDCQLFFFLSLSLSSTPLEVFGMRNDVWGREKIVWFSAHRSWLFFKPRESRRRRLFSLLLLIDIGFCEEPSPHFVCQLPLLSSKLTFSLPRPLVFRRSDSKQRQLGDTCRAPFASPSWTTADKERGIKKERKKKEWEMK